MARYQFILDRLDEIGYPGDGFVVDCACGLGHGTLLLKNAGLNVKGFDISPKIISKYVMPLGVDAECADIVDLPLDDDSVDIFLCSETLEHLEEDKSIKAVEEIKRVCVKNALICITVPLYRRSLKNPSHKQYVNVETIRQWFDKYSIIYQGSCNTKTGKKKGNLVVVLRECNDES